MKTPLHVGSAALVALSIASAADGVAQVSSGPHHSIVAADNVQWKSLRPGAEIAVVSGDPSKEGSAFVVRFRYSDKARVPPHWHPTDEHLTVLSGTFRVGMGERGEESATTALATGAYAFVPAKMAHYAWADAGTVVQVHGIGPFVINYVNPEDDPNRTNKK